MTGRLCIQENEQWYPRAQAEHLDLGLAVDGMVACKSSSAIESLGALCHCSHVVRGRISVEDRVGRGCGCVCLQLSPLSCEALEVSGAGDWAAR